MTKIELVQESELRGRGRYGFPTGEKMLSLYKATSSERGRKEKPVVIVNAAENDIGSFKDRLLLRHEPHKIIEGAIIAARAVEASACYLFIRKDYYEETVMMQKCIIQAYAKKLLGKNLLGTSIGLELLIHPGAGSYITGEESALIQSLQGEFPVPDIPINNTITSGLFGLPTLVLNVETVSNLPAIIKKGPKFFISMGRPNNRGTKLFSISGEVNEPNVIEACMSIPLKDLIENYAGGVRGGWNKLVGIFPGGPCSGILNKNQCEQVTMDFDSLKALDSSLGTGSVIVLNDHDQIFESLLNFAKFYSTNTCHTCPVCRDGVEDVIETLKGLKDGHAHLSQLKDMFSKFNMPSSSKVFCGFGDSMRHQIHSIQRNFPDQITFRTKVT